MDRHFEQISEIIEKKISSRIHFMVQDVQEIRKVHAHMHMYKIYFLALCVY